MVVYHPLGAQKKTHKSGMQKKIRQGYKCKPLIPPKPLAVESAPARK